MKMLPVFVLLPLMLWLIIFARIELGAPERPERPAGTRALQEVEEPGEARASSLAHPEVRPAAEP